MDGLVLLLGLAILGIPMAGLALGLSSRRRLRELEDRVRGLESTVRQLLQAVRGDVASPADSDAFGWRALEGRLGGTWLSRVGALAVTVGIAFFLKYAFENGWIQPAGRIAIGIAAGVALLLAGERLQRTAY